MPIVTARFLRERQRAWIVIAGKELRLPFLGELGAVAQYPRRGEGHGHRARNSIFALVPQIVERGARDPRAFPLVRPSERVQAGAESERHELVVRRMVFDPIDAIPEAVVGSQLGRVTVRLHRERLHPLAADEISHAARALGDPTAALPTHCLHENPVRRPGVVADQGRRLVGGLGRDLEARIVHGLDRRISVTRVNAARSPTAASTWHRGRSQFGRTCTSPDS